MFGNAADEKSRVFTAISSFPALPGAAFRVLRSLAMSQVMFYTLDHMRGMLFLATLVLILWTKNIIKRWYRKQVLTREFFGRLIYMGMTIIISLLATAYVWLPMYEAYACIINVLDRGNYRFLMENRDMIMALLALLMLLSSMSSTDIVIRPNRIDDNGMAWLLRRLASGLGRVIVRFLKAFKWALSNSCKSMKSINQQLARVSRNPCARLAMAPRAYRQDHFQFDDGLGSAGIGYDVSGDTLETANRRPRTRSCCRDLNCRLTSHRNSNTSLVATTSQLLKNCVVPATCKHTPRDARAFLQGKGTYVSGSRPIVRERMASPPAYGTSPPAMTSPPMTRSRTRLLNLDGRRGRAAMRQRK